jgi:hypothetical protein
MLYNLGIQGFFPKKLNPVLHQFYVPTLVEVRAVGPVVDHARVPCVTKTTVCQCRPGSAFRS